jgi:xylulokinase
VLLAVSDQPTAPVREDTFVCHHVVEGLWGQIVSLLNGGSALTWALELTGQIGQTAQELDRLLESAPPGSDGLQCWPFLSSFDASGVASGTKGRLAGIQLSHRPAHLLRAVVEGLAFELNRHLDFLRRAGGPVTRLVISGGAAASRVTPQIIADVTGLPLACGADASAGSALGAAIIARGLIEPGATLAGLAEVMTPPSRPVDPGRDALFYQEQYGQYRHSLPLLHPDSL